jgi:REP element-mobilizing transposase RayT
VKTLTGRVSGHLPRSFRCYLYFRWDTYRRRPVPALEQLSGELLEAVHPEIHILEQTAPKQDVALMTSLQPTDSASTAASKLKGAASKTLRELEGLDHPTTILAGGYFAATVGDNTSAELDCYLEHQSEHHGYASRVNPPVWLQTWTLSESDLAALQTAHAVTTLRWHFVFSTWNRQGVFTRQAGQDLAECWQHHSADWRIRLQKISTLRVPDRRQVACRSEPSRRTAARTCHLRPIACTRARDQLLLTAVDPASEFLDDVRS